MRSFSGHASRIKEWISGGNELKSVKVDILKLNNISENSANSEWNIQDIEMFL